MVQRFILLTVFMLIVAPARAQQPTAPDAVYPTVIALQETVVPAADPLELAERFRNIETVLPPPESVSPRKVGEQQAFWIIDSAADREFQINATLRVVGEHIYMWVEDGAPVSDADLRSLTDAFDNRIYDDVRELWGTEASPGIDGDPRLYGLFAYNLGAGTLAYFANRHTFPAAVYPTSNQHEMFFFNLDTAGTNNLDTPLMESTIAHEFQHMIRANIQQNEDIWLNEGFSTFTEMYLYNSAAFVIDYLSNPGTQLNAWTQDGNVLPHYGASSMFVAYFYERYGLDALRTVSENPGTGLNAFDVVLRDLGEPGVDELFADWVLANYLMNPEIEDGRYGYEAFNGFSISRPLAVVAAYPHQADHTLNQYAADYYVAANLEGKTHLTIALSAPDIVGLLPTQPASGNWMWYSNRGDLSNMTLTRAFDLTSVTTATLNYKIWHDTEQVWDFGYVLISTDSGESWEFLRTPYMGESDPSGLVFGPGYNGVSGGWLDETIALDAYAGQNILLRFELLNDEAISQPGMAIDDVRIPEIGYSSDFEIDGGGWEAAGWIRTDNRLPQQVWVQAVQQIGNSVQVTRWLAPSAGKWTLPLDPNVDQVLIAIAPFAPVTTVPLDYILKVDAS
ncbi:MAG: immune inhibitor A [Anaerolineae bacterium]|nr:immune inhibitor A [Anaerolineae bacterium]